MTLHPVKKSIITIKIYSIQEFLYGKGGQFKKKWDYFFRKLTEKNFEKKYWWLGWLTFKAKDIVLVASDGIWDNLTNTSIKNIIRTEYNNGSGPREIAQLLVNAAIEAGIKPDDTACVVAFVLLLPTFGLWRSLASGGLWPPAVFSLRRSLASAVFGLRRSLASGGLWPPAVLGLRRS